MVILNTAEDQDVHTFFVISECNLHKLTPHQLPLTSIIIACRKAVNSCVYVYPSGAECYAYDGLNIAQYNSCQLVHGAIMWNKFAKVLPSMRDFHIVT